MAKTLDLNRTVCDLVSDYPELVEVMVGIGFSDITKPLALKTVGRIMTIPKGCAIKDFDLADVIAQLEAAGFRVKGAPESECSPTAAADGTDAKDVAADDDRQPLSDTDTLKTEAHGPQADTTTTDETFRRDLLHSYVQRLSAGEDLDSVRAEFVENFEDVDAAEIMEAEQAMIDEGAPLREVQRLCDVHAALYHGHTHEETLASTQSSADVTDDGHGPKMSKTARLIAIEGHPLQIFTQENERIAAQIARVRSALDSSDDSRVQDELTILCSVALHYKKKGDLIYPLLASQYDISGPSKVMWVVDDEIKKELRHLAADTEGGTSWRERVEAVLTRADEMIYKESNILFPLCAKQFTQEEFVQMRRDFDQYEPCLIEQMPAWSQADEVVIEPASVSRDEMIILPGGSFTPEQLQAVLNTMPMEITFVDAENINRFFNEGPKVFKRPKMALGRDVFSCHLPRVEGIVRQIVKSFRSGAKDSRDVWMNKNGVPYLVRYLAVRDTQGAYLGTLECVQDMTVAQEHFSATS